MAILKFNSYARQKSGEEYCSEVESYAQNMIESSEAESSIAYPSKTEFATFRAPDYRITTDTLHIVLPYPIYKVVRVLMKPTGTILNSSAKFEYEKFKKDGEIYIPDVTRFFVTNKEWQTLPDLASGNLQHEKDYFGQVLGKSNTIPYDIGASSIYLSSHETKRKPHSTARPAYEGMMMSALTSEEANQYEYEGMEGYTLSGGAYGAGKLTTNPMNWEFQIEYIPMTPATKIKAVKSEPMPIKYTQVVNQRAEVSNAEAFGKYLHETAQKTGTEKLAIVKQYTKIADVPPVGALVTHKGERYRIVANSWNVTNTTMFTVTHLMSKNWSSKSKHIAVDQKYRNWDIPFDSYIWRTIYREEFICLSGKRGIKDSGFIDTATDKAMWNFFTLTEEDLELKTLFFMNLDQEAVADGVVLPVVMQGVGNSMVFSATMQDNMSAGLRIDADDNEYCTDVIYCNADGTMMNCKVWLSPTIANYAASVFPEMKLTGGNANNVDSNQAFHETYYVDKDAGEALKFTIQVHFVAQEPWIVIGNKLAQDYPFVTNLSNKHKLKREFKLWVLENYIRNGTDKLDESITITSGANMNADCAELDKDFVKSYILVDVFDNSVSVSSLENIQGKLNGKAWAITDMDNNLYIGSNDITKRKIYFTWKRDNVPNADDVTDDDIVGGGGTLPDIPDIDGPDVPDEPDTPDVPEEPEEPPEEIATLTFYVNDNLCWYIEGMTWQDWCVSRYNTVGAYIESGADRVNYDARMYLTDNGKFVSKNDFIEQGKNYIARMQEIMYFTLGGVTLMAEVGMTWEEYLNSGYRQLGLSYLPGTDTRIEVGFDFSGSSIPHYVTLNGRFVSIYDVIDESNDYQYLTMEDAIEKVCYINGKAYIYQDGMNWKELINSDYASTGLAYYTNSNRVWVGQEISGVSYDNYLTYNGKFVAATSDIVAGRYYSYDVRETDAPVANPTPIAPDEPWQTVSGNAATVTGSYMFNAIITSIESGYHRAEASFTSNGEQFSSISTKWDSVSILPGTPSAINIYYDDTLVYNGALAYNGSGWVNDEYRHIDFGGGALVPIFVHKLLYNYATRVYATGVLEYDLSFDGTYYVCNGLGGVAGGNLLVTDTYLGKPVKYINDGVFSGKNVSIGSVIIGNNVERIGYHAFYKSGITDITLGNGLKTIGEEAFRDCYYLEEIYIPRSVESIGARAFYDVGASTENGCTITYDGTQAEFNAKLEESTNIFGQEMKVKLVFTDKVIDMT